jgi:RNA polymerase sigma-70 factor (ECF subfamily)
MQVGTGTDEEIYARLAPELVRFATGVVGRADAPDVVAESFLRLFGTPIWAATDNHRALLYRRVYLDGLTWLRADGRRRVRERRAANHERAPDHPDLEPEVADAVRRLSPQQRAVVFLTYWDDLTPAVIAELLDVSEGTVRKQLTRARAQLRKVLA